jgi:hypothetical protein
VLIRLASLRDFNHDPRLDDQAAIKRAEQANLQYITKRLVSVKHVDVAMLLHSASFFGGVEVVKLCIVSRLVPSSADFGESLILALFNSHVHEVKEMLKSGLVDPSTDENLAIRLAAETGNTSKVELLKSDERVNPVAGYALTLAAEYNHPEVVDILLKDSRFDGESIQMIASCA